MIVSIRTEIDRQLASFRNGSSPTAFFAQQIESIDSTSLMFQNNLHYSPDMQYRHEGAEYPGLIVEVAYSQSNRDGGKNLLRLAEQYIIQSRGNIKLVVGISIEYVPPRKPFTPRATVSVWRPKLGKDEFGPYLKVNEEIISEVLRAKIIFLLLTDIN